MLGGALVLGVLSGVIPNTLLPMALQRMEAAPASLVQAAGPLIVTLMAGAMLQGEKPTARMLAGIGLGFCGIALVVGAGGLGGGSVTGALLVLAATFSYALSTIWVRSADRGPAAALALGQQAVSGVLSGSLALAVDGPGALVQPPEVWLAAVMAGRGAVLAGGGGGRGGAGLGLAGHVASVEQYPLRRKRLRGFLALRTCDPTARHPFTLILCDRMVL